MCISEFLFGYNWITICKLFSNLTLKKSARINIINRIVVSYILRNVLNYFQLFVPIVVSRFLVNWLL